MGLSKDHFRDRNIYIDYDFENVMFRYEHNTRKFFRKFYGKSHESEVPYDNNLLNQAILFGAEIDEAAYNAGKPQAV